ncbi:helix-turn-helix domain-containing protein [Paenibacillus macerans]|uniref:Helix-turn-helix domain protein n=1 Tax=Paenibacillus macerans TaxID=44252 RepID=A0A090ZGX8_PAEMA|nr:AraC family transcriptional regulator [Paenibacillus macerans]KFN09490.1 helix-turn-helix domain protein [Paenibacillus macerans]MBS5909502.1 helix-turn-helix domain-containing protein [Paenibacillus macerans]MCY7561460.1 AraC family transcriptional regulator [Paenibacillus macerans]MEC0150552.1 AraC family transcriptional regulator [Paenibacillus macerans]MUG22738.1 helix-turn-helix domain-containing protein [Paenibacillus macerans]
MLYINFSCPPLPHLIVGGISLFRKGDIHERRILNNTFDLIFVFSGALYLEENGRKYIVEPGQFLILPPDNLHKGYKPCTTDTAFSWIHFSTTGSYSYSESPISYASAKMNKHKYYKKDTFYISLPQYGMIDKSLHDVLKSHMDDISQVKIDKYHNEKLFYPSTISQIQYQQLFLKILTIFCDSNERTVEKDVAAEIYDLFTLNYGQSFTLNELAEQYAFHPAHIIRCVKHKYGMSPLQLLLSIRLNKAKQLLADQDKTVNWIAASVGFSDTSYFCKQFKKSIGMTPLEYRKIITTPAKSE